MAKSITVSYTHSGTVLPIPLTYTIETEGNVQTIVCSVDSKTNPQWLQIRKFDLVSLKEKNVYVPLFNEKNNEKNVDTALFIDHVYIDIMQSEKLKVKLSAEAIA